MNYQARYSLDEVAALRHCVITGQLVDCLNDGYGQWACTCHNRRAQKDRMAVLVLTKSLAVGREQRVFHVSNGEPRLFADPADAERSASVLWLLPWNKRIDVYYVPDDGLPDDPSKLSARYWDDEFCEDYRKRISDAKPPALAATNDGRCQGCAGRAGPLMVPIAGRGC